MKSSENKNVENKISNENSEFSPSTFSGDSFEKAMEIYNRLFDGPKPHFSPCEHQGIAMKVTKLQNLSVFNPEVWEEGVSHVDREGNLWSGNLKGFVQYRNLLS